MSKTQTQTQEAPGRSHREGITLVDLFKMFPDNKTAEKWFESNIWRNGRTCGRCGSCNTCEAKHPSMPYWCSDCRKYFSVKFGTVMEHSKITYQQWAIATYQFMTNVKGISSMKLHRDLGIAQSSAWFMVQRLREAWKDLAGIDGMKGPVEVDEKYVGGSESNKHADKKSKNTQGRSTQTKAVVAGIRDRATGKVSASPVPEATQARLTEFITQHVESKETTVYTDSYPGYTGIKNHETVNHKAGEYVRGQAHTNGIESFWALLERGYDGIYHHISHKHLHRYVNEFAGRLNIRNYNTIDMMILLTRGMMGKRLTYAALIA